MTARHDGAPPDADRFAIWCAVATLAVALASLTGLATFPLLDVDEPRFVTASRTMARGGDWIVPWFNGAERFDKPILVYWLQATAMRVFGEGEFAARLPSALAIAGAVPMVAGAARLLGLRDRFAVLAGVVFASCAGTQVLARGATADALLLFVTAWMARLQIGGFAGIGGPLAGLGVWIVGALAFLTKGPPALVAPLALAAGILAAGHRPRRGRVVLGFAVAAAIVLAWAVPALVRTKGRFWTVGVLHHVVERSLRPFEGHGGHAPWWYAFYLVAIPIAFLPWSPFLLKLCDGPRLGIFPRRGTARILGWWFWGTVAAFTVVTSKLPHYPLPAFPALAVAVAAALQHAAARVPGTVSPIDRQVGRLVLAAGWIVALALPTVFVVLDRPIPPAALVTAFAFASGAWAAGRLAGRGRSFAAALATAATWLIGFAMLAATVLPQLFWNAGVLGPVTKARAALFDPAPAVRSYALSMPSLVYYLDRDVPAVVGDGPRSAEERVLDWIDSGEALVVTRRRKLGPLLAAADAVAAHDADRGARLRALLERPKASMRGFLSNKGKVVELLVLGR